MLGNSFANALEAGNSCNNGSNPNWQRRLYGWVRDPTHWDFMEPDGCS